jgi:hypothetical protein
MWAKPSGSEYVEATVTDGRMTANGSAIGGDPLPYRLTYELVAETDYRNIEYVTSRLMLKASGLGWRRSLELTRLDDGGWTVSPWSDGEPGLPPPGGDPAELRGALDVDIEDSPLTNSMPVLRHGLHRGLDPYGRTVDFTMVFVTVPELTTRLVPQHYTPLDRDKGEATVRYSSGSYTAELSFDSRGFVLNYPGVGRRIEPTV